MVAYALGRPTAKGSTRRTTAARPRLEPNREEVVPGLKPPTNACDVEEAILAPLPTEKRDKWTAKGRKRTAWQREEDLERIREWISQHVPVSEMEVKLNAIRPYAITRSQLYTDRAEVLRRDKLESKDSAGNRQALINHYLYVAREAIVNLGTI